MIGNAVERAVVDLKLVFSNPNRKHLAYLLPRDRIAIVRVGDHVVCVDQTINNLRRVEPQRRKRQKMKLLFFVQRQRGFLSRAVNSPIVDFRKLPTRDFIEMLHRSKRLAIEKIFLYVVKWPFHFAFGLRSINLAGPRLVAIVRGES